MAAFDSNGSPTSLPTWFGFVVGLLAGFAASSALIGLVLGYSLGGATFGGTRGGTVALSGTPEAPTPPDVPAAPSQPVPPVTSKDHVRGNPKAKITVIEYSDFECPFCKRHHPTLVQLMKDYPNDVNWVYRHFPLSFHQNAQKEAEASECAAEVGGNDAFWKYADALFEKGQMGGTGFALDQLVPLAKELGINETKFKSCLDSGKYEQYVKDQMQAGIEAGVQGTPGNFLINNDTEESRDISGAVPLSTFKTTIDAMLGKK